MHLILMTRGIQRSRDDWKAFMQAQWFDWVRRPLLKDDKGNFIKNEDGTSKLPGASYFVFYVVLMTVTAVIFIFVARGYRERSYIQDETEVKG